jgi:hypothetical protein
VKQRILCLLVLLYIVIIIIADNAYCGVLCATKFIIFVWCSLRGNLLAVNLLLLIWERSKYDSVQKSKCVFIVRGKSWIYLQALETGMKIMSIKRKLSVWYACVFRMKKRQMCGSVKKKLWSTHINKTVVILLFDVCLRVNYTETLKALFSCNLHL